LEYFRSQARKSEKLWEKDDPRAAEADDEMHASLDEFYAVKAKLMTSMYDQTRTDIFDASDS